MRQKRALQRSLFVLLGIVVLYCFVSSSFSVKLSRIRGASDASRGLENMHDDMISDDSFKKLFHRYDISAERAIYPDVRETLKQTPIVTVFWFGGAKSLYYYTYKVEGGGQILRGNNRASVVTSWELVDGKWRVVSVYEAP